MREREETTITFLDVQPISEAKPQPDDTLAVENLIAKVRLLLSHDGNIAMLRAALDSLDRVRGGK